MKKVCVVVGNRADYGRLRPVLLALRAHEKIEPQIVLASPALFSHFWWNLKHSEPVSFVKSIPWYVRARLRKVLAGERGVSIDEMGKMLERDGFPIAATIPAYFQGGNARAMIKSSGLVLLGVSQILEKLQPDLVLVYGDRFEILPVVMASAYANHRIAHIEGGDVSGTIDESIRHAITKFAHIHFPVTEISKQRIMQMGERPEFIFPVGMSAIDQLVDLDLSLTEDFFARNPGGSNNAFDLAKPFALCMYHPVTTRGEDNHKDFEAVLKASLSLPMQKIFLGSNIDSGSAHISKIVASERQRGNYIFLKTVLPDDFYRLLANAQIAVGNSSSFLREGAYFGTPVVLVGDRQKNRERGMNVLEVPATQGEIERAIQAQLTRGRYDRDIRFGIGNTGTTIAAILGDLNIDDIPVQKHWHMA
jgi:UDP-hydrolysing UDP-N-acetyl-D-glucosamine 2-epimerase